MAPLLRRRRLIRRLNDDRLSNLPDGVLHQILTLLPIDSVVRTSALSSRWRYLWRTNPSLHFPTYTDLSTEVECDDYVDAIDSCLDLCTSTEHFTSLSFTISWLFSREERRDMANYWARFAAVRIVDSLSFKFEYPDDLDEYYNDELSWFIPLPDAVFCCWSITTLKLDHCALFDIPPEFGRPIFPFLETVFLRSVAFIADTLSGLISSSPKIKKLNIAGSRLTNRIVISSPTLETLDMYRNVFSIGCPVEISLAPRLRFLGLCCDLTWSKTAPLVNIEETTLLNDTKKKFHDRTEWRLLVSAVRNARVLGADEWFTQFMLNGDRDFGRRLPVFENLKWLDFCGRPDGFNWVLGLVHNLSECPVLEELYFRLNCMWSREGTVADDDDLNPDGDGDVLATKILEELKKDVLFVSPLKKVAIEDFTGEAAITTLVQFLLYRASLLESVVLYHCKHDVNIKRGVTRARKKMLNVQKASPSVKIAIIDSSMFCDGSISEKQPRQTLHWNPYFDDF